MYAEFVRSQLTALWMLLATMILLGPAHAEELPDGDAKQWHCWLGDDEAVSITCILPAMLQAAAEASGGDEDSDLLWQFATAGGRERIVQMLRSNPGAFGSLAFMIPLYTYPFDMEDVKELARSMMCRGQANCFLAFHDKAPAQTPTRLAALAAAY